MSNADTPDQGSPAAVLMREMRSGSSTPTIAVMGEFSAGKSTLINLLLNRDFLPRKVTATQLPAISLSVGDADDFVALGHDGTWSRHPIAVFDYIKMFYNPKRKHARNGMLSPVNFERQQKLRHEGV